MRLQHYLSVSASRSEQEFLASLVSTAELMGFSRVSALVIKGSLHDEAPAGAAVSNAPGSYAEASRDLPSAQRDPLLEKITSSRIPAMYSEKTYLDAGAMDLYETQAPYEYKNGLAVGIQITDNVRFLFGVDREERLPTDEGQLESLISSFNLFATHACEGATTVIVPELKRKSNPLSNRELEIMKWTLIGKSAWEISVILGISEQTVRFHTKNVISKLHVGNRMQAAVKCVKDSLISP